MTKPLSEHSLTFQTYLFWTALVGMFSITLALSGLFYGAYCCDFVAGSIENLIGTMSLMPLVLLPAIALLAERIGFRHWRRYRMAYLPLLMMGLILYPVLGGLIDVTS